MCVTKYFNVCQIELTGTKKFLLRTWIFKSENYIVFLLRWMLSGQTRNGRAWPMVGEIMSTVCNAGPALYQR